MPGAGPFLTTRILGPITPPPVVPPDPWHVFLEDFLSGRGAKERVLGLYDRDRDGSLHGVDVYMEAITPSTTDTWETLKKFVIPWPDYVLNQDRVDLILFALGGDGPGGGSESRLRISVSDGVSSVTGVETILQTTESRTEVQAIVNFTPVAGADLIVTLEAFDNSGSSTRISARATDRAMALQFTQRTQGP